MNGKTNLGRAKLGIVCTALILLGTIGSILAKLLYQLKGPDLHGNPKNFEKPWASTLMMFLGMAIVLPFVKLSDICKSQQKRSNMQLPLLDTQVVPEAPMPLYLVLFPTCCDLVATILLSVGLLWVSVSIYQMMRAAEMLFAAILAVTILRRQLNKFHWMGLLCCVMGTTIVGVAGVGGAAQEPSANGEDVSNKQYLALLGMCLIVASQAVQASQVVVEDYLMSSLSFNPIKVVGWEGVFGCLMMGAIIMPLVAVLPGRDGQGIHEDSRESWHMLMGSPALLIVSGVNIAQLGLYNVVGMCVTEQLGAVTRTVLESTRTLFVWLLDLLLFYSAWGGGQLGEPWNGKWSVLQAIGFAILVGGTFLYSHGDEVSVTKASCALLSRNVPAPLSLPVPPSLSIPKTTMNLRVAALHIIWVHRLEKMAAQRRRERLEAMGDGSRQASGASLHVLVLNGSP